ncbi:MAG: hypothetical protein A2896_00770 [Candidatus Nealsonbacteria bacterium RIFCSPLOWO2_01_FULL_43_32]|uniref:Uncharacterized protein n=1 Tax=Candidatus Nealsonbacteria bacterium RIFCSPLOWO2_01_FULL_43_32 TaxID=1801672 RepID=A0A1G2EHA6_9BACT|nr:MAG: hypothetical protein A2896_00770 [Candidatus Nealsonbacteria bacterium RIFCSPLOWO2_01_FULL_43_32]
MARKSMLVVMETGPGGNLIRVPRCIIHSGSSVEIREFMLRRFQAKHDDRYSTKESQHFQGLVWDHFFELEEVQVEHLVPERSAS